MMIENLERRYGKQVVTSRKPLTPAQVIWGVLIVLCASWALWTYVATVFNAVVNP